MNLRELVYGTGLTELTLNNLNGKYMAGVFAPWPQETGLGYFWRWQINGIGYWYGRTLDLSPDLSTKAELLKVTVGMMDDPLKNHYLTNLVPQDTIANMITFGCQEWGPPSTGLGTGTSFGPLAGVTYTVDSSKSGKGPKYPVPQGYDCSRTRMFMFDFIKDLLVTANDASNFGYGWSGYVDSTKGPTATTLYIFQQGANTYGSSITYGANISTIKNSRNILRSKNVIEYVGGLSNSEPLQPYDPWTENDLSMWQLSSSPVSSSSTHFCPVNGIELKTGCYAGLPSGVVGSILVDSASIVGTGNPNLSLDLNLQTALGASFNAIQRNATSLNFYYKIPVGASFLSGILNNSNVQLKDNNNMVIQALAPLGNNTTTTRFPFYGTVWPSFNVPIGPATQRPVGLGTGSTLGFSINLDWKVVSASFSSVQNFDWANITDIIFNVSPPPLTTIPGGVKLYIDHLYFAQSYQPQFSYVDVDARAAYGQRMQFYPADMYFTDKALKAFAAARTTTLSPPAMQIDVVTSLGPEAETNTGNRGFQPGWVFPAGNVAVSNYGYNLVSWRAIEVETHVRVEKDAGLTTRFKLVPASTTGVGVDMAKFDSRRFWIIGPLVLLQVTHLLLHANAHFLSLLHVLGL